jgi:hypothetical protein
VASWLVWGPFLSLLLFLCQYRQLWINAQGRMWRLYRQGCYDTRDTLARYLTDKPLIQ